jgi:hypothetical protein
MKTVTQPLSRLLAGACILVASAVLSEAQLAFNNVSTPLFSAFSTSSSPNTFMGDGYNLAPGTTSITGFDIYPVNVSGTSFTGLKINIFVWGNVNTSGTVNATTPAFGNLLATYTLTSAGNFATGFYFPFEGATPGVTPGISLATPLAVPSTQVGITFNYQGTTDGVNYSSFQNLTSIISSNAPTTGSEVFNGYYRNAGTPTETDGNFTSALRSLGGLGSFQSLALRIYTVPEPSAFALAGLGASALLAFRRRK